MTNSSDVNGYDKAVRTLEANISPRSRFLDRLERYYYGTQYQGRASWWDDDVPLQERAPCVRYDAPRSAIRDLVAMSLGEGKFPRITTKAGEDDTDLDEDYGLDEDTSRRIDAFVNGPLARQVRLRPIAKGLMRAAMRSKTALAIVCVRNGRLVVEEESSKWATPEFVPGTKTVARLEIRYPYLKQVGDAKTGRTIETWLYRRVIDDVSDTTYLPALALDDGTEPTNWIADKNLTVIHGLGLCPVIWYPRQRETCSPVDFDGVSVHETQLDACDAINMSISQRHRAALYSGDPQPIETGVADDIEPSMSGRTPMAYVDQANEGVYVGKVINASKPARRKGPGVVWRYPNENSRVELLTLPGDALKPIDEHQRDLRSKLQEGMAVVSLDPENAKHAAEFSGVAIKRLYMRMTSACDDDRDDFGDNCLLPLVDMLLRVSVVIWGRGERLLLSGFDKVAPLLAGFVQGAQWVSPELSLVWGEYFDDSPEDELNRVTLATTARDGGLVPLLQAVEKIAPVFQIKNAAEVAEQLEEEAAQKQVDAIANAQAMASIAPKPNALGKPATPPTAKADE